MMGQDEMWEAAVRQEAAEYADEKLILTDEELKEWLDFAVQEAANFTDIDGIEWDEMWFFMFNDKNRE